MIKINDCNNCKIFQNYFEMYLDFTMNAIDLCEIGNIKYTDYMKMYNPVFEQIKRDMEMVECPLFIMYDDCMDVYDMNTEKMIDTYYF